MMSHEEMVEYFHAEAKKIKKREKKYKIIQTILIVVLAPILFMVILMIQLGKNAK